MEKHNEGILESLKSMLGSKGRIETEERRPVKWISEGPNVWRVVWAEN